jgi:hypothetical protein
MVRWLARRAPLVLLAAAATCGSPFRRGTPTEPTFVIFNNQSLDQAAVYVIAPGSDYVRIGTVMAGRTDVLEIPSGFAVRGSVNIVARLLARSVLPQTGFVSISPGERYEVTLSLDARILSFLPSRY